MSDQTNVYGFNDGTGTVKTFWISWWSWHEDDPETPFTYWVTGSGMRYKLKKSYEAQYPEHVGKFVSPQWLPPVEDFDDVDSYDWVDEVLVSDVTICAVVEAADEDAAYAFVERFFPGLERRFCEEKPGVTAEEYMNEIRQGGRFL